MLKTKCNIGKIWVCGSSCLPNYKYNDIDVFFPDIFPASHWFSPFLIYISRNAYTLCVNNKTVQLCKYSKPNLKELVESFDFAHIKVGCEVELIEKNDEETKHFEFAIRNTYISDDAIASAFLRTTWFTGSEYPLSSLLRLYKYSDQLNLPRPKIRSLMIEILGNIVDRGFHSYDDLKDQLDAIDLQLEDITEDTIDALMKLCNNCSR